jgi:hypothetical protein
MAKMLQWECDGEISITTFVDNWITTFVDNCIQTHWNTPKIYYVYIETHWHRP